MWPHAVALKKVWLVAAIMAGHDLEGEERVIDAYATWPRKRLQKFLADIEEDIVETIRPLLVQPKDVLRPKAVAWLVERFDAWRESGLGIFTIATAQEFEARVGKIGARRQIEVPPYTELLLQPGSPLAFRHPEYMLARDLVFLYELFRQAEDLLTKVNWSRPPEWAPSGSENGQSLARTVILTSYNLLESFVSGLAREYVMEHPTLAAEETAKLLDTRGPLRKRILAVPKMVTSNAIDLDINKPPLSELMGDLKARRDAFVHCEPGAEASKRGYVKESLFHDVRPEVVDTTVDATIDVIRRIWKGVHGKDGPRWLPERQVNGHFPGKNLQLTTGAS